MSDLLDLRYLAKLSLDTVRDPQEGAREVLRVAPPRNVVWLAFGLMVVVSLVMGELVALIMGPPEGGPMLGQSTLVLGLMQAGFLFITIFAISYIGRLFSGTGDFDGALTLVTWLQIVFFFVQLLQLALMLVAPVIAAMVTVVAIGLFFWLLVNFIAVLHGFQSVGMVFVMTVVSFISILFIVSLILTVLGFTFDTGVLPNEL